SQNSWHAELYRAECENGAASVDRDGTVRITRHTPARGLTVEDLPPVRRPHEGHQAILGQFLDWLDGGPIPPTALGDNLRSAAMIFAAIEASRSHQVVDVGAMVREITGE